MQLVAVEIGGFRNIQHVNISISKLTALVSENNYGKSNVMDAIDFAFQFIKSEPEVREKMMTNPDIMPLNKMNDTENFSITMKFLYKKNQVSFSVLYSFEFIWAKSNHSGCRILHEQLQMKENKKNQRYSILINRQNQTVSYKALENGRCDKSLAVEALQLALQRVRIKADSIFYQDVLQELINYQVYRDRHFDASKEYMPNPLIYRNQNEFDLQSITNIPRVIFHLKKKYEGEYQLLSNTFLQLFPYIKHISVQEFSLDKHHDVPLSESIPFIISEKIYSLYVQDEHMNQPLPFTRLSDGAKRIFLMLTYVILAKIQGNTLIMLEEPENSIHPRLLQSLLISLNQLGEDCCIIFASHSPYIMEYMPTEDIYIGKPNPNGVAEFAKIHKTKIKAFYKDAEKYSASIGQYLFELLSGDEEDTASLMEYLES